MRSILLFLYYASHNTIDLGEMCVFVDLIIRTFHQNTISWICASFPDNFLLYFLARYFWLCSKKLRRTNFRLKLLRNGQIYMPSHNCHPEYLHIPNIFCHPISLSTEAKSLDVTWTKVLKSFPPCYSQSPLLPELSPPPPHPLEQRWFETGL